MFVTDFKTSDNMAKVGRPKGDEKGNLTLSIRKKRIKKLRQYAVNHDMNMSEVVENALEKQYGI